MEHMLLRILNDRIELESQPCALGGPFRCGQEPLPLKAMDSTPSRGCTLPRRSSHTCRSRKPSQVWKAPRFKWPEQIRDCDQLPRQAPGRSQSYQRPSLRTKRANQLLYTLNKGN